MKIVIIGSGNVAYHLAKAFTEKGVKIFQIFGRNHHDLMEISNLLHIPYSTSSLEEADLYIIAVSDHAISEVSGFIKKNNALVVHTSGSLPVEIMNGKYRKAGFYPLQTFSKSKEVDFSEIPIFVESENPEDLAFLKNLAKNISGKVLESDYEKRKYIHLTAVFACNFVNHLFARGKEISDSQNIPFDYFLPLIKETTDKIFVMNPKDAQTGPARRNDERVLKLHEELLKGEHLDIYKTMNQSIKKMYEL